MKTALFSVSYAGLWGQARLSLEEFIPHAAALGYDGVMIMGKRPHASPLGMNADRAKKIKDLLGESNIACACVAAYTDFSAGRAAEVPFDEMQVMYVTTLAMLAKTWGASIVRVFTAYEHEGVDWRATWDKTVAALRECADRAGDYGITVGVQNHHDLAVHTDAMAALLAEVDRPNCEACFDAWSPALRGEDLYEVAKRLAPLTVLTTNADYVRLPRFRYRPAMVNYTRETPDAVCAVPFGEGFIDYDAFFKGLADGGFDGWAAYEMCSPLRGGGSLENLDHCAGKYLDVLRRNA